MVYNWQLKEWPGFKYNLQAVEQDCIQFSEEVGRVSGVLEVLSESEKINIVISNLVAEAVKTSEIEGEYISRKDVLSSVKNQLGLSKKNINTTDKRASGIANMMLDVRDTYKLPLSESRLFLWHKMLMKENKHIAKGKWRTGTEPMQIVSGSVGKEKVHFEAPPSKQVPDQMKRFIEWFNATAPNGSAPLAFSPVRAAIAHLYFETIHPFEDGNGRIGRAISEKVLSQGSSRPVVLSLSQAIESDRNAYYKALMKAQRGIEITDWLKYFVKTIRCAQENAEAQITFVLKKSRFFDRLKQELNERQRKVIRKIFDQGPEGFEGGMNARKYMRISKASKATATRDLQDLVAKGILKPIGQGRSSRYEIQF